MKTLVLEALPGWEWDEKTRTVRLSINDEQVDRLREQLGPDPRERPLLDKATENLLSRVIGEKLEAQLKLRELELTGFKCSACGCHTQRSET